MFRNMALRFCSSLVFSLMHLSMDKDVDVDSKPVILCNSSEN